MIREDRYIVISKEDIRKYLTGQANSDLVQLLRIISDGRYNEGKDPNPKYVCIRDTWPEYEKAWKMLEERVDSENSIYS